MKKYRTGPLDQDMEEVSLDPEELISIEDELDDTASWNQLDIESWLNEKS